MRHAARVKTGEAFEHLSQDVFQRALARLLAKQTPVFEYLLQCHQRANEELRGGNSIEFQLRKVTEQDERSGV